MHKMLFAITAAALLLSGCATAAPKSKTAQFDPAMAALEQSAKQIETDLRQLVLLQAGQRKGAGLRAVLPKKGPLGKKIVMNWNGAIEPAIKRITRTIRYKYTVLGAAPAAPVIVKVNSKTDSAYNVLDSIAWQASNHAHLLVDPLKKKITIAYLPTFGGPAPSSHTAPTGK